MQINAVSNRSVASKSSFGHRMPSRDELEQLAAADDMTLKKIAVQAASDSVNDKKHKLVSNALWYSLPVAGGLAAIVRNPGVIGRIPKLKLFAESAALWAGSLAVIDATYGAKRVIDNHSPSAREFSQNHPVLSTVGTVAASIGALILAGKGASKLVDKYGADVTKFLKNHKVDKYIEENKLISNTMKLVRKLPSAIKSFAKGVIDWSPMILVFTSIAHTFRKKKKKTAEAVKNYTELKGEQAQVREMLSAADYE